MLVRESLFSFGHFGEETGADKGYGGEGGEAGELLEQEGAY